MTTRTMGDVATSALRRLRLVNVRKTPDSAIVNSAIDALNQMMHSWKGLGVDTDHETLVSADPFPLDEEHVQGTIALLAIRLASDHGLPVSDSIAIDAVNGWSALQAEFVESAPAAEFDRALTRVGRSW